MRRLFALVAALIVATAIAWADQQPPRPLPAAAPPTDYSAARAMADIRAFASEPHPIGSDANHVARDYLVGRMAALGLSPQVRKGVGFATPKRAKDLLIGGDVENIVGVLPGRDRNAPAVALMAHYDSVPGSSGAADDAAGAASALEIARAIKAQGTPARDVMVILTDGEESGLLGAHGFFARDPLARRVGFVINMEARGDAGRVQMFETAARNGETVRLLQHAAARPQATSLSVFVYERMPNDTDFTVAKAAGIQGLNFAFAGRQFDYHAASSVPATLDLGTLQDMGRQGLAAARAAAFAPRLPAAAPSLVYSQLFGDLLIAYPPAVGWLVLLIAAGLIALAVTRARRVAAFPWTDLARGAGAGLFALLAAAAVLHLARRATGAAFGYFEQRFLLAQVTRWEIAVMLLGVGVLLTAAAEIGRGRRQIALLPLAAGLAASLFGGFDPWGLGLGVAAALVGLAAYGRPIGRAGAWGGVLILTLVLAAAAQALAAPTAFTFAWPLLVGAAAAAATDLSCRRSVPALLLLAAFAAVALGWLGGFAHQAFISLDLVELTTMALAGAAAVAWPLAQPAEGAPPERLLGPALVLLGLAVTLAVRVNNPYNPRYPDIANLVYLEDQDAGRAWIASTTPGTPAWSRAAMAAGGGKPAAFRSWIWRRPIQAAPAPYLVEAKTAVDLSKRSDGTLRLIAVLPPGAREIALVLKPDTPLAVTDVQGAPANLAIAPGGQLRVVWDAATEGLTLILKPAGPGKLRLLYDTHMERWPAGAPALPQRPADVMPFGDSGATYLTGERQLAW